MSAAAHPVPMTRAAVLDAAIGIAWWNSMTERERRAALQAADTAIPAVAFDHWRQVAGTERAA